MSERGKQLERPGTAAGRRRSNGRSRKREWDAAKGPCALSKATHIQGMRTKVLHQPFRRSFPRTALQCSSLPHWCLAQSDERALTVVQEHGSDIARLTGDGGE